MPQPLNGPDNNYHPVRPQARTFELLVTKTPKEAILEKIGCLTERFEDLIRESEGDAATHITFELRSGTLEQQHNKSPAGTTRYLISDLIIEAWNIAKLLAENPHAPKILISLLPDSQITKMQKFAIREVLQFLAKEQPHQREFVEAESLAKCLSALTQRLKIRTGEILLQELNTMTQAPEKWGVVLDHVLAGNILTANLHQVLPILRRNYQPDSSERNEALLDEMESQKGFTRLLAQYLRGDREHWQEQKPSPDPDDDPFLHEDR